MNEQYQAFLNQINELDALYKAMGLLNWDRETNMPKGGMRDRIVQMTTLRKMAHRMGTSAEMGDLLSNAENSLRDADPDSDEVRLVRVVRRNFDRSSKLPPELVQRSAEVSGHAREAWVEARANNDFAHFQPHLEQIVTIVQEMAEHYGYEDEKYDALLDNYEQGMKSADVRATFDAVKNETVPLLQAIVARGSAIDDSLLHQPFDVAAQKEFSRYIAMQAGYDFNRGHLGTVVHPFATSFSRNDARITSRWSPDFINPGLFGTLHESGHAMYEQGTHPDFARTPLARGTSLGFHESQSRMIENMVGRSLGFWQAHYGKLQETFPAQLGDQPVERFYRAINKVQPSFIRVEADELTYNFHIILRFELEQALLNGELAVKDLPEAWNAKFEQLLGIVPPTDTVGCLQDVHWSGPSFGYFPTYALGNLYAAQLFDAALAQNPTIEQELALGQTGTLVAWLGENVHQYGSKFTPTELILKVTGKPLSAEPFLRYVKGKFGQIYNLDLAGVAAD